MILFFSFRQNINEREFRSSDSSTGGFSYIKLTFSSNKEIDLIITKMIPTGYNQGGTNYESKTTMIKGKWLIQKDQFTCKFDTSDLFIKTLFKSLNNKNKGLKIIEPQTVIFPLLTDTLFIQEIPCIWSKK